jgi:hypothetical protein
MIEEFDATAELDRQVDTLLQLGYPAQAGIADEVFTKLVAPLREQLADLGSDVPAPTKERVPFVLVVSRHLVPAHTAMPLTSLKGRAGFVSADTEDIGRFQPIEGVDVPSADAYLLVDVERGDAYRNVTPDDALTAITRRGRTPLTYDEGIAFVTHFPASLEKNHCFSLVASRCGDRRVPALWISKNSPKLGWCWAGNPHTWLGSASCATRLGPPAG